MVLLARLQQLLGCQVLPGFHFVFWWPWHIMKVATPKKKFTTKPSSAG